MSDYDLVRMKITAQMAIDEAFEHKAEWHEAINWGDLHCVEAAYYVTDQDTDGYYVLIEECSPGASKFQQFIRDYLKKAGYIDPIEVRTEW